MRTEFLCISVLREASGPRVKLASCKSALNLELHCLQKGREYPSSAGLGLIIRNSPAFCPIPPEDGASVPKAFLTSVTICL